MTRPRGAYDAIWRVVARIPRGRVATYGQVARMAGYPGAARFAGWALAALPEGLRLQGCTIPWHRVINAQGRTSPRAGDSDGECRRQLSRLAREGVRPGEDGAIDRERYGWDGRASSARPSAPGRAPASGRAPVAAGRPARRSNWSSHRRA
jgi:methylated-DNA-protein-cysteine methyltransferase-like protein